MAKYTKDFEAWWGRANTYINVEIPYVHTRVKQIAFNAWKAGKKKAKDGPKVDVVCIGDAAIEELEDLIDTSGRGMDCYGSLE